MPAGEFVEARIVVPATAFTGVTPGTEARLPTVLEEERNYIEDKDAGRAAPAGRGPSRPPSPRSGAPVPSGWCGASGARSPSRPSISATTRREPLDDPPAVTASNLSFGTVPSSAFSSTVVDLAERGHLTITEEGPKDYRFSWKGNTKDPLLPHDRELLENLFRGQPQTTSKEFAAWGQPTPARPRASGRTGRTRRAHRAGHPRLPRAGSRRPWLAWGAVVAFLFVAAFVVLGLGDALGLVPLVAAVVVLALGGLMRRRTVHGAEKAEEAKALKRFLKDFSTLDEAPVASLVVWERYLVAAVTLGVAADLVRGLAMKVPEVANSTTFATWYVVSGGGGFGRLGGLDHFGHDFASTAVSALAPSSSGSGGGFSGDDRRAVAALVAGGAALQSGTRGWAARWPTRSPATPWSRLRRRGSRGCAARGRRRASGATRTRRTWMRGTLQRHGQNALLLASAPP